MRLSEILWGAHQKKTVPDPIYRILTFEEKFYLESFL